MHKEMMKRLFFALFAAFCGLFASAQEANNLPSTDRSIEAEYNRRIALDKINGVYIPKNLDDVFAVLNKMVDAESKFKVKTLPEEKVDSTLSPRLGLWMKLNWSLFEGSRLSHYLRSAGVSFPDDMASFMLLAWHQHLNGKPIEIKALATGFKEKRKLEWEAEQKKGKVIFEEKRPKTKN